MPAASICRGPSLSEPSREFQLLLGRPHSGGARAGSGGAGQDRGAGREARWPPKSQDSQDGPQERPAALTMPPWWFPRGRRARPAQPGAAGRGTSRVHLGRRSSSLPPRAPPLPRQPEAERSSEGSLLGSRVTPVPWGPRRGRESRAVGEKGPSPGLEASPPAHTVRPAGPLPVWGGETEAGPGCFACVYGPQDSVWFASLAAPPGLRWPRPG